jgi:uncharacterized repeat protein (TIGR02543 family)
MKKTLLLASALLMTFVSLSSCGKTYSGSIDFYDGTAKLGTIKGLSGQKVSDDDKASVASYEKKTGFVFSGWFEKEDFSSTEITVNTYPYVSTNLYAKFVEGVKLTFKVAADETIVFPDGADANSYAGLSGSALAFDLPTATKDKSFFAGWKKEGDTTDTAYTTSFYPDADLTLVAMFASWPTVSFVTNVAGFSIPDIQVEEGASVTAALKAAYAGKTPDWDTICSTYFVDTADKKFKGWYKAEITADTCDYKIPFNFETMVSASCKAFAWFAGKTTVTFQTNAASYPDFALTGFEGDDLTAPILDTGKFPAKKYFEGWYTDASLTTAYKFTKYPKASLTLYGKWTDDPVLTFIDTQNSNAVVTYYDSYEPGSFIDLTPVETSFTNLYPHDTFLGFKVEKTAGTVDPANDTYITDTLRYQVPKESTTIYASFRNNYKLTIKYTNFAHSTSLSLNGSDEFTASEFYGSSGSDAIADPSQSIKDYIASETALAGKYKPAGFYEAIDENAKPISFPYAITAAKTIYVAIAGLSTLNLSYVKTDDTSKTPVNFKAFTGFEGDDIKSGLKTPLAVSKSNTYLVYGEDTGISSSSYAFGFSYVNDNLDYSPSAAYTHYQLGLSYPSASVSLVLVFKPVEAS